MKTSETIFRMIEQGDVQGILADKVFLKEFQELMENDHLSLVKDKLVITEKGKVFRKYGREGYPLMIVGEELPEVWVEAREQLRLVRDTSLLVISTWLLVFLYIFYYCLTHFL